MANETQSQESSAVPKQASLAFADMDGGQKAVFICKVFVFLISGGFAYPTIFAD